jgi:hypothetical protein
MDKPALNVKQLSGDQWPHGDPRPLAVLPWEPEEMPLSFEDTWDDLDYVKEANIELPDGWQFGLRRHRGSPTHGVAAYVVADESQMAEALRSLLKALHLQRDQLVWVSPLASEQAPSGPD